MNEDTLKAPNLSYNIDDSGLANYTVELTNVGNPDLFQQPTKLPGTISGFAPASSLRQASALCRQYINFYNLGGGNWNGGKIYKIDGEPVAVVSYNGRLWTPEAHWRDRKEILHKDNCAG